MLEENSSWVDVTTWKDRWEAVAKLAGGGQGEAFRVTRKSDGQVGFLKIIKSKNDPERRARFSREANAYDTFRIANVPRLLESNAHRHADAGYVPFLVTDFIEGSTLAEWRAQQTQVTLATGVELTCRLLDILAACHAKSLVHRDVKPDNIILENNDPARPWLLDFGLNHHEMPDADFTTEDGQEVGNRFLRLPELSAGSRLKQDPRSDVSFAGGILFYVLTGHHPNVPQDGEGKLPHQRSVDHALLQAGTGDRYQRLAAIFDHTFAPRLEDRYTDAETLRDRLMRLMRDQPSAGSLEDDISELAALFDTPIERRRVQADAVIRNGLHEVQRVYNQLLARIAQSLTLTQTNFNVGDEVGANTLYLTKRGSIDYLLTTTYEIRVVGDELVLQMSGDDIYRTNLANPSWDGDFDSIVSKWLSGQIKIALSPNAMPPEVSHFKDVPPFGTLELAAEEARRSNRKILAFAYDPTQEKRGRLDYALSNFLQNRKTRDLMNGAFVTALVPLSQIRQISEILNGASMETSRWVLLDTDFNALKEAVIYPNPQEAERIVGDLAKEHGPD
ncbi:protein kinase [Mesorhizobium sp. LNJC394B00]|uniref:serine/threonine protein kinase n=1 Tax=Mesorhizobium sp. LNJC394B00 TaxID=1287274 RepID=UPI0003CE02B2|nr:protein kinase [Mesorhizobium sp. LNJC394B00]ESY16956.1 hypothetical protein X750_24760 [Mesorhizobium sp. LNJC394B00]